MVKIKINSHHWIIFFITWFPLWLRCSSDRDLSPPPRRLTTRIAFLWLKINKYIKKNIPGEIQWCIASLGSSIFMKPWESILPKPFITAAFHILQTCGGIKCPHSFFCSCKSLKVDLDKSVSQMPKCNINVFFFPFSKKKKEEGGGMGALRI